MIGTKDVALALGVSEQRVRQFVDEGRIPAQKVAGVLLFDEADIERFAAEPRLHGWQKGRSRLDVAIAKLPKAPSE